MTLLEKINRFLQDTYAASIFLAFLLGGLVGLVAGESKYLNNMETGSLADWVMVAATFMLILIGSTLPHRLANQALVRDNLLLSNSIRRDLAEVVGDYELISKQINLVGNQVDLEEVLGKIPALHLPKRGKFEANSHRIHSLPAEKYIVEIYDLSDRIEAAKARLVKSNSGQHPAEPSIDALRTLHNYLNAFSETYQELWHHLKELNSKVL